MLETQLEYNKQLLEVNHHMIYQGVLHNWHNMKRTRVVQIINKFEDELEKESLLWKVWVEFEKITNTNNNAYSNVL